MISIERILCPIDFSDFSRHALDRAVAVAKYYDAAVTVLHVVPEVVPPYPPPDAPLFPPIILTPEDLKQFQAAAEHFVRTEVGDVAVTAVAQQGSAVGEIVRFAERWPADLLVMGTHGRSGFDRLMLGSVAERVLRKAPCPVLTVPRHASDVVPAAGAPFKRIVCGVDFSPSSLKALQYAVSLAEEADARLSVMHVLAHHVFEPTAMAGVELPRDATVAETARQQLHAAIAADARTYADVCEIVQAGKPSAEILRRATEDDAELIVLGARGAGLADVAFGSTAAHVVREALCPVLTVKA
jgi:nucleotide-binding universal stress UspA family protein